MVHMLVAAGARRYLPDSLDQTPEEIANYKEYGEVVDYFVSLRSKNDTTSSDKRHRKSRNYIRNVQVTVFICCTLEKLFSVDSVT